MRPFSSRRMYRLSPGCGSMSSRLLSLGMAAQYPRGQPMSRERSGLPRVCGCGLLAEHSAERIESLGYEPVPDPQSSLLARDESRVVEDLHVVADGRLGAPRRLDEITGADLVGVGRGD